VKARLPRRRKKYRVPGTLRPRALAEHIEEVTGGFRIVSHRTGKSLGTYKTRGEAARALARMRRFSEAGVEAHGDCRYITIGGRRTCMTGGHNHTALLQAGQKRMPYYGLARPGRRRRRAFPADVGTAAIGTATNMASATAQATGHT